MVDPATGAVYNAVIDGDTFRGLIFQALYSTELIPLLPGLIFEVSGDYFGTLGNVDSLIAFDQSVASGMYMSVICAEDADFKPATHALEGATSGVVTNAIAIDDAQGSD